MGVLSPLRGEYPFCAGFLEGVAIHTFAICYDRLYANQTGQCANLRTVMVMRVGTPNPVGTSHARVDLAAAAKS